MNNTGLLKALNIITIISIGILGSYFASVLFGSSDMSANDKDIISIIMAIAIVISTFAILSLFTYSTVKLYKGIYERGIQRTGAILLIAFVVIGDLFVIKFFAELKPINKLIFISLNIITVLQAVYSLKRVSK